MTNTIEDISPGRLRVDELENYFKVIRWLRKHPIHAVYLILGIDLSPHQRITFKKMWECSNIGLKLSRGLSKSFLDGVYLVMRGLLYSNATQVVLTNGFRGGKLVLRNACQPAIASTLAGQAYKQYAVKCLENYRRSPKQIGFRIINRDPDLWTINFRHGSNIQTGPLGKDVQRSSPLKGLRANTSLILDESADIGDDLYTPVIRPFARVAPNPVTGANEGVSNLKKIESGTIRYDWQRYTRELRHIEENMRNGNKDYAMLEFNYEDCFHYVDNKKPSGTLTVDLIKQLILQKKIIFTYRVNLEDMFDEILSGTTSWEDFLSENKNKIQTSVGNEFSMELLDSIVGTDIDKKYLDSVDYDDIMSLDDKVLTPLLESEDKCVLGVDPARERDDAAFILIRLGPSRACHAPFCDLINAKALHGKTFQELYSVIREYLDKFPNIVKIIMDCGGGGYAIRDLLWYPMDGRLPIYDPDDPDTPSAVRDRGLPLLQMDFSNNEKNTVRVGFLKGQMQSGKFLMPPYIYLTGNQLLDDQYRTMKNFKRQCSYILSAPSGNFKRFYTEQEQKKDLFSACLLAMQKVYDVLYSENQFNIINECAMV